MKKYKIGICGHFGGEKNFFDGQTIKTKILYNELIGILGEENLSKVDTYMWIKRIPKLLIECIRLSRECEHIIIILSNKGRNIFLPYFYIMQLILKCKVHCMVIGGGFPIQMKKNKIVSFFAKKIDGVYVETNWMIKELNKIGYKNVYIINNFKRLDFITEERLNLNYSKPFEICTFSRVCKGKGIEDIINAVNHINNKNERVIFKLDIYGQVEKEYQLDFSILQKSFPSYINYKGIVEYDKSVDIIKNYFLLAFPTKYKTEGVPGTIIDAYAAGVPVIASKWDSCNDVIDDGKTGVLYEFDNQLDLIKKLEEITNKYEIIINMKKNCLNKANEYLADNVIKEFLQKLDL